MPLGVRRAAERFARRWPQFGTPEGAYYACEDASRLFAMHTRGAVVVHALGSRRPFPRAYAEWREYGTLDRNLYHVVCRIGRWYVDVTRRQMEPNAAYPFIQHERQFRREWRQISTEALV